MADIDLDALRSITLYKAHASRSEDIPDLRIVATRMVPDGLYQGKGAYQEARDFYATQGQTLCDLLRASLPGGTVDALLVALLNARRSLLRVPFSKND